MSIFSIWQEDTSHHDFPSLKEEIETDVCIVGAGITGLTCAFNLVESGRKVVVLEALQAGQGTSGFSSNHLNTQVDYSYQKIIRNFGNEAARCVADSRKAAIANIEHNIQKTGASCEFKRIPGYLYTETEDKIDFLEQEEKAAKLVGLEVSMNESPDLPFKVAASLKFNDQAQFNSQKYLEGLLNYLADKCEIYEHSRVVQFNHQQKRLVTERGAVKANHIFFATHLPLFINIHQTSSAPYRSYIQVAELESYPLDGLYWDLQDPYHYTRNYQENGSKYLVVGGADHKTGENDDHHDHYKNLESYVRTHFPVKNIVKQWSSQYYEPADGLPYIGKTPFSDTYMATGFSGDGLVYGTVAASIVCDMISGIENSWHQVYNARRFKPIASARNWVTENVDVARHFVLDRFKTSALEKIEPGNGAIVSIKGKHYAVSKDENQQLSIYSATCPHLGCLVQWNPEEKSWDCPCHGSRFTSKGELIVGPATHDLKPHHPEDLD